MEFTLSADDIHHIKEKPGLYVGSTDVYGVYRLLFDFIKAIIRKNKKSDINISIQLDQNDIFFIVFNSLNEIIICAERYMIEALSCDFKISEEQGFITLVFKPDNDVFTYNSIEYHHILIHLIKLAQLNSNVSFTFINHENKNVIQFRNGLDAMLLERVYHSLMVEDMKPLNITFVSDEIEVNISMLYTYYWSDVGLSFVNQEETLDGGTHVDGFLDGLYEAFIKYIEIIKLTNIKNYPMFSLSEQTEDKPHSNDPELKILIDDVIEGLNFVISLNMAQPLFGGSVKRQLINEDVYSIVKNGVIECLSIVFENNPSFFNDSNVLQKAERRILLSESNSSSID